MGIDRLMSDLARDIAGLAVRLSDGHGVCLMIVIAMMIVVVAVALMQDI